MSKVEIVNQELRQLPTDELWKRLAHATARSRELMKLGVREDFSVSKDVEATIESIRQVLRARFASELFSKQREIRETGKMVRQACREDFQQGVLVGGKA